MTPVWHMLVYVFMCMYVCVSLSEFICKFTLAFINTLYLFTYEFAKLTLPYLYIFPCMPIVFSSIFIK